ncbi:hypothetical protein [Kaistia sp. MMO-174]|uniref:hypothetical protein n=1 Tax=Kaistia sp. MMO-174 TaxID=3081256 RepID=UPI00301A5BF2
MSFKPPSILKLYGAMQTRPGVRRAPWVSPNYCRESSRAVKQAIGALYRPDAPLKGWTDAKRAGWRIVPIRARVSLSDKDLGKMLERRPGE